MAATKFGISGGIAPAGLTGPITATIGLATETDTAFSVAGVGQEAQVTEMGISGGIGNFPKNFTGKARILGQAQETDTAFAVIDPNAVIVEIGLATESDQAFPVTDQSAAIITSVASSRGTNILAASESLQINVDDSTNINAVTANGVNCTSVVIITPTEVQCVVPLGIGAAPGSTVDLIVDNGVTSTPFPVTFEPPLGFVYTSFTVDYAGLDPDSPFAGDTNFSNLAIGDVCIYSEFTTPSANGVSMDGLGEFTLTGTVSVQQQFDYYIYDTSDGTNSPTIEQITVQPGPVEVLIGQASETDTAFGVTPLVVITATIGTATESDTAFPVIDGSGIVGIIGLATETDTALPVVAQGPVQTVEIGLATETDTAFAVLDISIPTQEIGLATETDQAFQVFNGTATYASISEARETDTAFSVTFPANLDSIREQINDLTAIVLAQQAQIDDLYTRFDLNELAPNTYRIDGATIVNNNFTLTKSDNLDGTFDIVRTDN